MRRSDPTKVTSAHTSDKGRMESAKDEIDGETLYDYELNESGAQRPKSLGCSHWACWLLSRTHAPCTDTDKVPWSHGDGQTWAGLRGIGLQVLRRDVFQVRPHRGQARGARFRVVPAL